MRWTGAVGVGVGIWLVLLVLPGAAAAQAVVRGTVTHAGVPVPNAIIAGQATPSWRVEVRSGESGEFELHAPAARTRLLVVADGFAPLDTTLVLGSGDTVRLRLQLRPRVVALEELQVTATPMARDPLRVPQSTTTLAGSALDRERGATIGATLSAQPGVAERWDGPAASAPVIRGLSGERIVILQDGQRTGDLAGTAPDHAVTIDPAAATRVEIVRGPAALLYGSNAIGGVVNVLTGDLPSEAPPRFSGSAELTASSGAGGGAASAEASIPLGERGALRVRGGARNHGDVNVGRRGLAQFANGDWVGGRRLQNTQSRSVNGSVSGNWRMNGAILSLTGRTYDFDYGLPFATGDDPVLLTGARHELASRFEVGRGSLAGARLELGGQWYAHDELAERDRTILTSLEARTGTLQAITPVKLPFSASGAVGVSQIWRDNGVTGDAALTPPNSASSTGVFLYQEFEGSRRVSFPVGARLDHSTVRSRSAPAFGDGITRRFTAVSGSAGVTVLLGEGTAIGASAARAVRAPTAEELFAQAGHAGTGAFEVGDPNLDAERALGMEVVLRTRASRHRLLAAAYVNRMDGFIALYPTGRDTVVSDPEGGERSYPLHVISQRDATIAGLEAASEWELGGGIVGGMIGDLVRGRDRFGEPLPFLPAARLGASARVERERWSIGVRAFRVMRQGRVPEGELRAEAHTLVGAFGSLQFGIAGRPSELLLRVDNLLDIAYRDAASRVKDFAPSPGRGVSLGWRFIF